MIFKKLNFILFLMNLNINIFMTNKTEFDFICGVNESYIELKSKPNARQKTVAIIEIGVFYDQLFYDRFTDRLQDFVKTMLRQVQLIFQYPSMNSEIHLVVTKLVKVEPNQVNIEQQIQKYMDQFCWFQFLTYWEKSKDYDLAVFLSGAQFYMRKDDLLWTRGIAVLNGVCNNWGRNCVLITALNFMDSWYLAHELGHSLGANHDFFTNHCKTGIMGSGAENPFVWSDCSNTAIRNLLNHRNGSCLYNKPKRVIWDLKSESSLPSSAYNADSQCSMFFSSNYKRYSGPPINLWKKVDPCESLWCSYDLIKGNAKCPLEGTDCLFNNKRGKCFVGKCLVN